MSGTSSASSTVSASVVSRRDLADGVAKPQLVVLLPDLPLGPTSIRVRNASGTVLVVTDEAFTVAPPRRSPRRCRRRRPQPAPRRWRLPPVPRRRRRAPPA